MLHLRNVGDTIAYKKPGVAVHYCGIAINNSEPFNHCKAYFGHLIKYLLSFILFDFLFLCIMSLSGEACHYYDQGNPYHEATLNPSIDLHLKNHNHIRDFYPSSHIIESKPPVPLFNGPGHFPSATTEDPFTLGSMTPSCMGLETWDSNLMEGVPTSSWPLEQTSMWSIPRSTHHCFQNGKQDHKNQSNTPAKITSGAPVSKPS